MSKCENFTVQYPPLSPAQLAELRRKMRLAWERLPKNVNLGPNAFLVSEIRSAIKDFVARRRPNSPGVCIVMDETRWDAFVDYLTHRADLAMLDMPLDLWDIGPNGCPYAHFATLFGAAGPILLWPRDVESTRALSFHAGIKLFLDDMASAKAPPTPHMSSKFRRVGIGQSST